MAVKFLFTFILFLAVFEQTLLYIDCALIDKLKMNRRFEGEKTMDFYYARVKRSEVRGDGCGATWFAGHSLLTAASCFEYDNLGNILEIAGTRIDAEVLEKDGVSWVVKNDILSAIAFVHGGYERRESTFGMLPLRDNIALVAVYFDVQKSRPSMRYNLCGSEVFNENTVLVAVGLNGKKRLVKAELESAKTQDRYYRNEIVPTLSAGAHCSKAKNHIVFSTYDVGGPLIHSEGSKQTCLASIISHIEGGVQGEREYVVSTKLYEYWAWMYLSIRRSQIDRVYHEKNPNHRRGRVEEDD